MPQHSFLSDEQITEILNYIRTSFGNKASKLEIGEVRKLRNEKSITMK